MSDSTRLETDWRKSWIQATRAARREAEAGPPLAEGIFPTPPRNPRASAAAAAEAVAAVAGTRLGSLRFSEGCSWADVENRAIRIDSRLLPAGEGLVGDASAGATPGALASIERLLGTAAHEGGHLRYTRRQRGALASRIRGEKDATVRARLRATLLSRWMVNLIEDERIERLLARRHRALIRPLMEARRQVMPAPPEKWETAVLLLALVRVPDALPADLSTAQEELLAKAREILTPFPRSFRAVRTAAAALVELLPESDGLGDLGLLLDIRQGDADPFGESGDWGESVPFRGREAERRARLMRRAGRVEGNPPVRWTEAPPQPAGYEAVRSEVATDALALAAALRALLPPRPGGLRSSGRLMRGRLRNAPFDPRVFEDRGRANDQLSLALILDLSGSMRGESERLAQRLAVLLAEAALCLPRVRLYVYGHSADEGGSFETVLVRFATPARGRPTALGELPILANNRDAHALREIRLDLARLDGGADHPHLAVLLADGAPSAKGFQGRAAVEATRDEILEFEHTWGPLLFVTTEPSPWASELAPGPTWPFSAEQPVPGLLSFLRYGIAREVARGRR